MSTIIKIKELKQLIKEEIEKVLNENHIGFDKLKNKLSHQKGITNPGALAASIGNTKYGKSKMHKAATEHHPLKYSQKLEEDNFVEDKLISKDKKCPKCNNKLLFDGSKNAYICTNCGFKESIQSLEEKAPKGWAGTVKKMKQDKEIDNPFALANYMKNKGFKPHYKEVNGKAVKKKA